MRSFNPYSKYRAKRTVVDGITFSSKAESELYLFLKASKIDVTLQPKVYLTAAKILFKPDFKAALGEIYYEMKGMPTPSYKIKARLWRYYGPGPLKVFKMKGKKVVYEETIIPDEASYE